MWLKILKVVLVVAQATGLDDKVKDWVGKKLDKVGEKADNVHQKVDELRDKYEV